MFTLEQYPLHFKRNALEPYMSENTINLHYGKHLDTYIKNMVGFISGSDYEKLTLEEIIKKSAKDTNAKKIFNNAAQVFNHDFFFRGLALDNGSQFPARLIEDFGSADEFFKEFKNAAISVFGSGWVWLIEEEGILKIETTANADTPIAHGKKPLLTLDVWEHAYYIDHQNRRADFIDAFLNHLVNWDFVSENIDNL